VQASTARLKYTDCYGLNKARLALAEALRLETFEVLMAASLCWREVRTGAYQPTYPELQEQDVAPPRFQ